jgi:hypothetical protein
MTTCSVPRARAAAGRLAPALLAIALLGSACARQTPVDGSAGEPPREPRRILVVVANDARTPTLLTVWVQSRRGGRQMLGTVLPDETNSFQFVPDLPSGDYVLVGRTAYGEEIVSNPFPISRTAVVSWSLFSNIATTSEIAPDEP